jgi:plasmid stability protein
MTDQSSVTVVIDGELAERLKVSAESLGRPVDEHARDLIREALDEDWTEDDRRFAEYERTGVSIPADQAFDELRASLERRFASRK